MMAQNEPSTRPSNEEGVEKPCVVNNNGVNISPIGNEELEFRNDLLPTDLTNTGWQTAYRIEKIDYLKTLIEKIKDEDELAEVARAVFEHPSFTPDMIDREEYPIENKKFEPAEHWHTRDKSKKEPVVDFINRVYRNALDGYFSVSDLNRHDPQLKQALYNWARDHNEGMRPPFEILNLPTKKQVNDRLLAELPKVEPEGSAKVRAKLRIHNVAIGREHRLRTLESS